VTASFYTYLRVFDSRPFKLDNDEVDYRETEGEQRCKNCFHFYERKVDGYAVCEIFRDVKTDDEKPVDPEKTCHFHTHDGDTMSFIEPDTDEDEHEN
jgi:hypothetical protein